MVYAIAHNDNGTNPARRQEEDGMVVQQGGGWWKGEDGFSIPAPPAPPAPPASPLPRLSVVAARREVAQMKIDPAKLLKARNDAIEVARLMGFEG